MIQKMFGAHGKGEVCNTYLQWVEGLGAGIFQMVEGSQKGMPCDVDEAGEYYSETTG